MARALFTPRTLTRYRLGAEPSSDAGPSPEPPPVTGRTRATPRILSSEPLPRFAIMRVLLSAAVLSVIPCAAAGTGADDGEAAFDPYYLGYGIEPSMDASARLFSSVDAGLCRAFGRWADVPERRPWLAPAWEVPLAALWTAALHEVGGHGGRAREYGLDPSYGIGFDLTAWTNLGRVPETNAQNILVAGAGIEADSTLAHRLTFDLYSRAGAEAAKIPMLLLGKLDLSLYVGIVADAEDSPSELEDQYREGYDPAFWLVARQAQRRGANPADVWNGDYVVDVSDPHLFDDQKALRAAALWNLLDPSLAAAMTDYVRNHVIHGAARVRPWALGLGKGVSLMAGTRAYMGAQDVTRFLDVYVATPWGVGTVYGRDIDSSIDRTWGAGVGWHRARVAKGVEISGQLDWWESPRATERLEDGPGWNATVELDALFAGRAGVSALVGSKSEGFFPGTPNDSGPYVQLALLVAF